MSSETTDTAATVTHDEPIATARTVTLDDVRAKLAAKRGQDYWRGLEEFAETDAFVEIMHREFPRGASELSSGIERRSFLKCMGASIALAGVTAACSRQPEEHIIPFVKPPVEMQPGVPMMFATAMTRHGYGIGLLAENHTGRPVKLEGNPNHPASLGATDIFSQASILALYDPDRSTVALRRGSITTWESFIAAMDIYINGEKDSTGKKIGSGKIDAGGEGIRVLTGTVTSPTLAAQIKAFQTALPQARWHQYEPVNRDNANAGARMVFGDAVAMQLKFDLADVVVSLDSNFLADGPGCVRYSRDFASRRNADNGAAMNRLYTIESSPSITGAMADNHLHLRPSQIETFARALAQKLGIDAPGQPLDAAHAKWVEAVAADLQAHSGTSIVLAGDSQPAIVHAIAHAINNKLGNAGKTIIYTDPVEADPFDQMESLRTLVRDMEAGNVDSLFIIGVNPVYDAPADLNFAAALQKANHRIHLGMYQDETSDLCHWHIPEAHYLESWGDVRAHDGTVSFVQPLIAPLYGGKTAIEFMVGVFGKGGSAHDLLRKHWQDERGTEGFETLWRQTLAKGVLENSTFQPKQVQFTANATSKPQELVQNSGLEISFRPDPTVDDGRWTNSGWLQEMPKPLTKLTWDNAVIVSFNTGSKLGVEMFDEVEVQLNQKFADGKVVTRSVRGQVWIQPGHPDDVVTLHLGYGRTRSGHVGDGTGFNAYLLRTSDAPWFVGGASVTRIAAGAQFARTELHQVMTQEGRPIVRAATLSEFHENPDAGSWGAHTEHGPLPHVEPTEESMFTPLQYNGYGWAMAIDLSKCTGCGVCAIACQAENNIPVVGKAQVIAGRQMHWIRIDRYYKGDPNAEVEVLHQPVPCMQCENAPCEVVCPVAATMHSEEGLNDMVYNRCVGTRYCSNNCPYKVRRFNFLMYSDLKSPTVQMMYNPDVTVRTRGVMEKCTYCVQRINLARIDAKKQDRKLHDGEITTACQQACPAGAIMFGDQRDPESRIAKWKASPRNYALLADLNTRPRTTYLAKISNPNPALEGSA